MQSTPTRTISVQVCSAITTRKLANLQKPDAIKVMPSLVLGGLLKLHASSNRKIQMPTHGVITSS